MNIDWPLLWHMGGYGPYVWTGWGVTVLALGAECLVLWRRSRRLPPPGAASQGRAGGRSGKGRL
jgi:heme exporter protein CcmD